MFRHYFLILLLLLTGVSQAQTSLKMVRGWGNKDRAGRWNPVLVRASDPIPRNVTLQLLSPEPGGFESILEEHIAIGPTPATFELLSPTRSSAWQQTIAVLRDSATGRFLAQYPLKIQRSSPDVAAVGPHSLFVGISGVNAVLEQLNSDLNADFGYLPPHQLPRASLGYDSLDVLILNRPRFADIDFDQQRAVLEWVHAGGNLLLTPGDDAPTANSQLAANLPCRIGDLRQVDLPAQRLSDLHLSQRFAHLAIHFLEPVGSAEQLQLFESPSITAYSRRIGLGKILVLPLDINSLQLDQPSDRPAIVAAWRSILDRLVTPTKPATDTPRFAAPFNGFMSESVDQFREGAATAIACDFLMPPPAASTRQWPHVALIMLVIFVLVGPLDALFLKLAGQSPWTWTTMVGWIASFVLAVLYASSLVAREPAAFRTLQLIDQSDDAIVATTELVALRSPQSRPLQLDPMPSDANPGWWEAALPGSVDMPGFPLTLIDLSFHQSDVACVPNPVRTTPGRARFFRRQSIRAALPALRANLTLSDKSPSARITGTIENLLPNPLKNLRLRTALGVIEVPLDPTGALAAGLKIKVDLPATGAAFAPARFEGRYQNFGFFGSRTDSTPVAEQELWAVVPDLAARRSLQIDALFEVGAPVVCIYAQSAGPAPTAQVDNAPEIPRQTNQWLRALIPLAHQPI